MGGCAAQERPVEDLQGVSGGFLRHWPADQQPPPPPASNDGAYAAWFQHAVADADRPAVREPLSIAMAAREPLAASHLEELGMLPACDRLPAPGFLFDQRQHRLQTVHLSLHEFLGDASRSGEDAANTHAGHCVLATSCVRILQEKTSGPAWVYALRYGHGHLTAALEGLEAASGGADLAAEAAVSEWIAALLEPRPAAEPIAGRGKLPYELSPWRARAFGAAWLERQAEHGRSRRLVPELQALEQVLRTCAGGAAATAELHGLYKLVQHLRWGVGTFWAGRYDRDPPAARAALEKNIPVAGPLHQSPASLALSRHWLTMPPRLEISPALHELRGHSNTVASVAFSRDGGRGVFGSGNGTLRVWDTGTGECVLTLEGHSESATSVCFSRDGRRVVSGSRDNTLRVWDVAV